MLRLLLPLSIVVAVLLLACGVIQNLDPDRVITTIAGGSQTLPGGPVASQEAIKVLGTNGGGFFNANSAHPYENPTPVANLIEIASLLLIPVALTRTAGTMLGSRRQGTALLAAMAVLWGAVLAATTWAEVAARGTVPAAAGAAMEGKETQFGLWGSALFATSTTGTSTGAVNGMHDSMTAAGGGLTLINMLLGEVSPGGVGSGLYGILIAAIVAVFVAGLMVGRTPELLGKKIGAREMSLGGGLRAGLARARADRTRGGDGPAAAPRTPWPTPAATASPRSSTRTPPRPTTTAARSPGLTVTSPFFQLSLAAAMLLGRFVPMVLVIALAGQLARSSTVPASSGTLPTHTPLFISLLIGVIVLVSGLTFFPALALGPIAEALS